MRGTSAGGVVKLGWNRSKPPYRCRLFLPNPGTPYLFHQIRGHHTYFIDDRERVW